LTRYILDSGIVTDFANRRNGVDVKAAEAVQRGDRVGIGTPVLGELLAGLMQSSSRQKNTARLERAISRLRIWPFDEVAARQYAGVAAGLRGKGIAIQQIDMQIAAIAFGLGSCVVVSKDSDFDDIDGLVTENWAAP
jgi:tRNA(fMet)-specific endonuclease VapC